MALARMRRGESAMNYWPGFVDALSTLILGIIFLLTVFVVVQFYLQQEVANKDSALSRLNTQVAQLSQLLSMEKSGKADLEGQLVQLRASLANAQSERDLEWIALRPELVVEVSFDHVSAGRIRHGAKLLRWREDKKPTECTFDQLA